VSINVFNERKMNIILSSVSPALAFIKPQPVIRVRYASAPKKFKTMKSFSEAIARGEDPVVESRDPNTGVLETKPLSEFAAGDGMLVRGGGHDYWARAEIVDGRLSLVTYRASGRKVDVKGKLV
jgi:hypothetical protein